MTDREAQVTIKIWAVFLGWLVLLWTVMQILAIFSQDVDLLVQLKREERQARVCGRLAAWVVNLDLADKYLLGQGRKREHYLAYKQSLMQQLAERQEELCTSDPDGEYLSYRLHKPLASGKFYPNVYPRLVIHRFIAGVEAPP